jgi:hypothetical protein
MKVAVAIVNAMSRVPIRWDQKMPSFAQWGKMLATLALCKSVEDVDRALSGSLETGVLWARYVESL